MIDLKSYLNREPKDNYEISFKEYEEIEMQLKLLGCNTYKSDFCKCFTAEKGAFQSAPLWVKNDGTLFLDTKQLSRFFNDRS